MPQNFTEKTQKSSVKIRPIIQTVSGLKNRTKEFVLTNKKIVADMKKSEALCLHADNLQLIFKAIGNPTATDDERIKKLLEAG
ncbi:MAG: hypothetical protein AB1393_11610 [Candidatus Edwardsbacteria bacterium]